MATAAAAASTAFVAGVLAAAASAAAALGDGTPAAASVADAPSVVALVPFSCLRPLKLCLLRLLLLDLQRLLLKPLLPNSPLVCLYLVYTYFGDANCPRVQKG